MYERAHPVNPLGSSIIVVLPGPWQWHCLIPFVAGVIQSAVQHMCLSINGLCVHGPARPSCMAYNFRATSHTMAHEHASTRYYLVTALPHMPGTVCTLRTLSVCKNQKLNTKEPGGSMQVKQQHAQQDSA